MRGYIVRRGPNSFAAVVYLGRDPVTGKEKRKWYSHTTRREAEAHIAQLVSLVQGSGFLPTTKLRTEEYLEQWLRDYATGTVAPTTLAIYTNAIRRHLSPAFAHVPLSRLSPQAIQGFLSASGQAGLSSATIHLLYRVLREALGHAVKWGLLARNPCAMVDAPKLRREALHVLDEEQVRIFLGEAKRTSAHYPLYLAAITTGMRRGELLGLRWKDLGFTLGVASIQQTFYRLGRQQLFRPPKTAKARRTIVLPPVLVETLLHVREEQVRQQKLLGNKYEDLGLVFAQPNGKPLHAHNVVQRDFRKVLARASLPKIRFHDLRHVHATLLLQQGVHPKVVQERLGHSAIGVTLDTYSHVLPGIQEQAVAGLQARLFGPET